jgi:hypothetical protein
MIHCEIPEYIDVAGRPADFKGIDYLRLVKTEVQPQVTLGIVAAPAAHFIHLQERIRGSLLGFGQDPHFGAYGGAV